MSSAQVSVTHEIKIGRESAWVKVGVNLDTETGDTVGDTISDASYIVNNKITEVIEHTVLTANNYESGKR